MTSAEDLFAALNCAIRFKTPEGEYEGVLKQIFVPSRMITVSKILLVPSKIKLGTLNFMFHEVSNVGILKRPQAHCEKADETSLIYFRTDVEGLFNLDGDSEIESESSVYNEEFVMKLLPSFSKWISPDSQIIDSFNNEFNLALKVISSDDLIGVSLEGPKISRNGILTWLCISTSSCTYLFDILALGKRAFQNGLKSILENSKIKKVFHDCRLASDCLFHMYNVCLINVFDTQVADSLVMMQENKNCSIIKQVKSLDACLDFYLQLPEDYLYSPLTFTFEKASTHYHGLRPLQNNVRGAMIKHVIYLPLLKRELETALFTPLRRATDVYLNVIQNATDQELTVAPPVLDELPPELLLEGIQIVRYQHYEYIPPIIKSGPPYRRLTNPIKEFVKSCRKFEAKEEIKCVALEDVNSQNFQAKEFFENTTNELYSNSRDFYEQKCVYWQANADGTFNVNRSENLQNSIISSQRNCNDSVCCDKNVMDEMTCDISDRAKTIFSKMPSVFGDLSIKMEQSNKEEKNCINFFIDPSVEDNKVGIKNHVISNSSIRDTVSSNVKLPEEDVNKIFHLSKNECVSNPIGNCLLRPFNEIQYENSHLSENECKFSNPTGNSIWRPFNKEAYQKDLGFIKSSTLNPSELFDGNSDFILDQEQKKTNPSILCEEFWNEIRKDYVSQHSNDQKSKIRFVPAGMAGI